MAWRPAPIGAGKHAEMVQTALQHLKERVESLPDLTLTCSMFDQTPDHRSVARGSVGNVSILAFWTHRRGKHQ